jgi:hypothetical protein
MTLNLHLTLYLKLVSKIKLYIFIYVLQGVPKTLMIDKGSEWAGVVPRLSVVQMKSTFNQVSLLSYTYRSYSPISHMSYCPVRFIPQRFSLMAYSRDLICCFIFHDRKTKLMKNDFVLRFSLR